MKGSLIKNSERINLRNLQPRLGLVNALVPSGINIQPISTSEILSINYLPEPDSFFTIKQRMVEQFAQSASTLNVPQVFYSSEQLLTQQQSAGGSGASTSDVNRRNSNPKKPPMHFAPKNGELSEASVYQRISKHLANVQTAEWTPDGVDMRQSIIFTLPSKDSKSYLQVFIPYDAIPSKTSRAYKDIQAKAEISFRTDDFARRLKPSHEPIDVGLKLEDGRLNLVIRGTPKFDEDGHLKIIPTRRVMYLASLPWHNLPENSPRVFNERDIADTIETNRPEAPFMKMEMEASSRLSNLLDDGSADPNEAQMFWDFVGLAFQRYLFFRSQSLYGSGPEFVELATHKTTDEIRNSTRLLTEHLMKISIYIQLTAEYIIRSLAAMAIGGELTPLIALGANIFFPEYKNLITEEETPSPESIIKFAAKQLTTSNNQPKILVLHPGNNAVQELKYARSLGGNGATVTFVEPHRGMRRTTRQLLTRKRRINIHADPADLHGEKFDALISFYFGKGVVEFQNVLKNLKSGGVLVFQIPTLVDDEFTEEDIRKFIGDDFTILKLYRGTSVFDTPFARIYPTGAALVIAKYNGK